MKRALAVVLLLLAVTAALAQSAPSTVPPSLVVEGVPPIPADLAERVQPYLDYRTANFRSWHPKRAEMLITTNFGDTPQLHLVRMPLGARKQLTFSSERTDGFFLPGHADTLLVAKDVGGNEQFQYYRLDLQSAALRLLTDGKSRNTGATVSRDGSLLAWASTRRNGNDNDIWIMDPARPESARMLLELQGGGWSPTDISPDKSKLLVYSGVSANESYLWLADLRSGEKRLLTPKGPRPIGYSNASFSRDGSEIYFTSDENGEFSQLMRMRLSDGKKTVLSNEPWEVERFDVSLDGRRIAYITNDNGVSVVHVIDAATGKALPLPKLPQGTIAKLEWHPRLPLLGFSLSGARSASDAYSLNVETGELVRWTESETGGLDPARNAEPELVTLKSFDGTQISAFVYRPDPARFPGRRPVIVNIHGGPEGQSRPRFLGRTNYWINELGIAVVYPNVRGSTGYGKSFLDLDNGFKREESVRDIGAILDWIGRDPSLDAARVGVYGGSYGGYMTLATMTHYNDRIRAGIDVVGISNFLTFLKNTSGYRRDLRRVEYGDERDPAMNEFLQKISPQANASKITKPLMVVAGYNDPRVPWTEGEQMVKTVRANGAPVWWVMAKDEGHGFEKKPNVDYQFLAMTLFWQQFLLAPAS